MNKDIISRARCPKKRRRLFVSCSECRRRKVKCDRSRPFCKQCREHNLTQHCHYDLRTSDTPENSWVVIKKVFQELKDLKELVIEQSERIQQLSSKQTHQLDNTAGSLRTIENIDQDSSRLSELKLAEQFGVEADERVDFYEGSPALMTWYSRMNNHAPLAWISMILKDPFLAQAYFLVIGQKTKTSLTLPGFAKVNATGLKTKDYEFKRSLMEYSGLYEVKPLKPPDRRNDTGNLTFSSNLSSKDIVISEEDDLSYINAKVIDVLPPIKVIWLLIDRFFLYAYPFMPYFDQDMLVSSIESLIGKRSESENSVKILKFQKRLDIATVGTLLYILKISYMSLESNCTAATDFPEYSEEESYLLKYHMAKHITDVAELCTRQFPPFRRYAIEMYQCIMMAKEYQNTQCSDSFGDGRIQIYLSHLVQVALSSGFNRDPTKFDSSAQISHYGALIRKIWHCLGISATFQSAIFGFPLIMRPCIYDTKVPIYTENSSNILDFGIEKETIARINSQYRVDILLSTIIDKILNVQTPPRVGELLVNLKILEDYITDKWTSLSALMTPTDGDHIHNLRKVASLMIYIESLSFMHPVYFYMMIHFEKKRQPNACFRLCMKILEFVTDIMSNFIQLFKYSYRYVGRGFDFYLSSFLETTIQRCLQIQFGLYFRSLAIKKCIEKDSGEKYKKRLKIINKFTNLLTKNNIKENFMEGVLPLADKSFFAWVLLRDPSYVLKLIKEDKIEFPEDEYNFLTDISDQDLATLLQRAIIDDTSSITNLNADMKHDSKADETNNDKVSSTEFDPTELDNFLSNIWNEGCISPFQAQGNMNAEGSGWGNSPVLSTKTPGGYGTSTIMNDMLSDFVASNMPSMRGQTFDEVDTD